MATPIPENESGRLRALQLLRLLDTAAEKSLDELTELAASICGTPISLISLVDKDRQWFKSRVGLNTAETPRDIAFCAHALMGEELFIVEDATKDERFSHNPLVVDDPSIRFYAGAPLVVTGGFSIGTLCVIDREPRKLTEQQKAALKVLSYAVVTQLELKRAQESLQAMGRLLPMCAWCRSVREDDGSWTPLHEFVSQAVPVTHSICPECMAAKNDSD